MLTFTQAILQVIVIAILSRLLVPEDFGLVGMTTVIIALGNVFSQFGIGQAVVQKKELTNDFIRVSFTASCLTGLGMTGLIWLSAPLATILFKTTDVQPLLRLASLTFLIHSLGAIANALLEKNLRFRTIAFIGIVSHILSYAIIGVTLALLQLGPWALVGAALSQSLIRTILYLALQPHPKSPLLRNEELTNLLHFGGGMTLSTVFNQAANQGDYFIVGRELGSTALGIYTRTYQLMTLPAIYFGQAIQSVIFPTMSRLQDERERLLRLYLHAISAISIVTLPLAALMIITAPELIITLLGVQWTEAIVPFQILAFGTMFRTAYKIDHALANSLGYVYHRGLREIIYFGTVILGSWIGLRWGLQGVAVGILAAVTVNYLLAAAMSVKLLACSVREFFSALCSGAALATTVTFVALLFTVTLRALELPTSLILCAVSVGTALVVALALLLFPQLLGSYGKEILGIVLSNISLPENSLIRLVRVRFELA